MAKIIILERGRRSGKSSNMKKLKLLINNYIKPEHEKDIITKLEKEQNQSNH